MIDPDLSAFFQTQAPYAISLLTKVLESLITASLEFQALAKNTRSLYKIMLSPLLPYFVYTRNARI